MQCPDGLPETLWALARKRTAPMSKGKSVSLINLMKVKRDLCAHLPESAAFACYQTLIGRGPASEGATSEQPVLREMPLGSLMGALAASSAPTFVLNEGGEFRRHRSPVVYGPAEVPTISCTGRRVTAGWLEDATVYARSAMIRQGDSLFLDADASERTAFPVDMGFDPVIFLRTGPDRVAFIDDQSLKRSRHLPQAISLLGINSVSFGHWFLEYLPQFLATRKLLGPQFLGPDAPRVPVLIDEDMPAQHAQSLMFFGRGGGPDLIRVPRGMRIHVERLFVVQNWMFAPHLLTTDQGLDLKSLGAAMGGFGEIYSFAEKFAGRRIEGSQIAAPKEVVETRRVFWARKPNRHRSIANWEQLRQMLEGRGYVTCFPEEMRFAQQVAALRAADRIVVQNGSGSLGLLLAKPNTRLLYLSHPDMSRLCFQVEAHAATGVEMRVLAGPFSKRTETWVDQSDYRIDMSDAEPALDWLEEGMALLPDSPSAKARGDLLPRISGAVPDPVRPPEVQFDVNQPASGLRNAVSTDLWKEFQLKSQIRAQFLPEEGRRQYIELLKAQGRTSMIELPIVGLFDRLKKKAQALTILDAPTNQATLSVARVIGPGTALDLTRVPRVVAGGWIKDAQAFSRSTTIFHEGVLLMDRQGNEADLVPQELAADAVLFGSGIAPHTAVFIEDTHPDRQLSLPAAWSLMGPNSGAFGHWSFETLAAFLTWRDRLDLEGVPVLVDADIPAQHLESLVLLADGRFPIVQVAPGTKVSVNRLFVTTSWYYTPHLMAGDPLRRPEGTTDFNVFGAHAVQLAGVFRQAGAGLDAGCIGPENGCAERLYLVRRPERYRRLVNDNKISGMLEARGFERLLPEEHDFRSQIQAIRSARQIVCQGGSLSHLAFFARPGTQMCLLHHPGIRTMAMVSALLQEVGVELTLAVGSFDGDLPKEQGYIDRTNYMVPVDRVANVVDGWDTAKKGVPGWSRKHSNTAK